MHAVLKLVASNFDLKPTYYIGTAMAFANLSNTFPNKTKTLLNPTTIPSYTNASSNGKLYSKSHLKDPTLYLPVPTNSNDTSGRAFLTI
jgi:hypothetical protein